MPKVLNYLKANKSGLVIIIILLIIAMIAFCPNYVRPAGQGRFNPPSDPDLNFLINKLNSTRPDWWEWTLAEFIERKDNPEVVIALRRAAHENNDIVSAHANLILFKIRDNAEFRLDTLIFEMKENNDNPDPGIMLWLFMGPEDIEYLPKFQELLESDNSHIIDLAEDAIEQIQTPNEDRRRLSRWRALLQENE
jgi:hypothetical protein